MSFIVFVWVEEIFIDSGRLSKTPKRSIRGRAHHADFEGLGNGRDC